MRVLSMLALDKIRNMNNSKNKIKIEFMKKTVFFFLFCFMFSLVSFGQMSDQQVVDYVKQENQKGTSQQQIATSLLQRGVSRAQMERIKTQYESQQQTESASSRNSQSYNRQRNMNTMTETTSDDLGMVGEELSVDVINGDFEAKIFGKNIFSNKNLTFNPSVNIPTPVDYRLGPGDEVIIDIWGASQTSLRQAISPEGSITVEKLGPLYLNGMTIKEANDYVQRKFANVYAGVDSQDGPSQIKLTLGQIRTIQVNVIGEVAVPGTYSLSSLSTVMHALYRAGGVNDIGSMRVVNLYRNGKLIRTLDLYKYIMDGKINDIRMNDGDQIVVPAYVNLVEVSGNVKRPMFYELTKPETLADLIVYSGGFLGDAYTKNIKVIRKGGNEDKIFMVNENDFGSFLLNNGDLVSISSGLGLYDNRIEIKGAVYRPGYYEIGNGVNTVKQLILMAEGVRGDAFLNRAILTREKEDLTIENIPIDIRALLYENADDIVLRKNDMLYIPSINDLQELGDLVIHGEVARPDSYKFADNTTLEDLIIQAGGLLESASTVKVDVARRITDPYAMSVNRVLSETYSFSIKDGFIVDGQKGFVLKPNDQVYVRRSPGYHAQQNISIEGEVLFPGTYALNKKAERLSDVIKRAGNITPDAYPQGARLVRQQTEEERFRTRMALKMATNSGSKDSISVDGLDMSNAYYVGIELDKALQDAGSDYDLVLKPGDKLIIPEYNNTIKINGAVMYPNTVLYKKGQKLSYYVNQAGGYADNAKKNKSFIVYMNGTVAKAKSSDKKAIQPGCEILIPSKEQARRLSLGEIVSLSSSVASMAGIVGLLINSMK